MNAMRDTNYFLNETAKSYQLVFNLFSTDSTAQLHAYLSSDRKRLHVVAKREGNLESTRNLWIFAMPLDADVDAINIDRKSSVYIIEVPKLTMWQKFRAAAHSVTSKNEHRLLSTQAC
jgi:hypothetical protein